MPTKELVIFGIKLASIHWSVSDIEKPIDPILEQDRLILSGKHPYQQKKVSDCPRWIKDNASIIIEPRHNRH